MNTSLRMVYPFMPELARGLGVEQASIARLITLRNTTGFLAPAMGSRIAGYGPQMILAGAMVFFAAGSLAAGLRATYVVLGASLFITALAKIAFDPAMQAYLGDTVAYRERGRVMSITEYAWSLSLLVGAPLVALAIARGGWQAPFVGLGILALISIPFLRWTIARSDQHAHRAWSSPRRQAWQLLRQNPVVGYAVIYLALAMIANEMLLVVFGGWLETSFALNLATLGLASAVIGASEIAGETFAGWTVDRLGKRPVIITTGVLNALCYLLLPYFSTNLTLAMVMLFLLFLTFEITIVGGMPLMTELIPASRLQVMSFIPAAMAFGRTVGALLGPLVLTWVGFKASGAIWATLMGLGVLVLALRVREASG
jgi:predicted MFS family arabinose efflux permease